MTAFAPPKQSILGGERGQVKKFSRLGIPSPPPTSTFLPAPLCFVMYNGYNSCITAVLSGTACLRTCALQSFCSLLKTLSTRPSRLRLSHLAEIVALYKLAFTLITILHNPGFVPYQSKPATPRRRWGTATDAWYHVPLPIMALLEAINSV